MNERGAVVAGMTVRSADGHKLGRVYEVRDGAMYIEKGVFFPKDYRAEMSEIAEIRDGEVILAESRDRISGGFDRETTSEGELRVPLAREKLDVNKREVQTGDVRVEKKVVTEQQEIDVPVKRERVKVERKPAEPGRPAVHAAFNEETVVVPVRGEEVDVHKRAEVDEEIVVRKDEVVEGERHTDTLRREEADVREEGGERRYDFRPDDPLTRK